MRILRDGGAEIVTAALEANLVDELHVVVHPLIVGGGKPALRISSRRNFNLVEPRRSTREQCICATTFSLGRGASAGRRLAVPLRDIDVADGNFHIG